MKNVNTKTRCRSLNRNLRRKSMNSRSLMRLSSYASKEKETCATENRRTVIIVIKGKHKRRKMCKIS